MSKEMKTVELTLIKKNRVYFKALNNKNYEVKLRVDSESENLKLNKKLTLLLHDESIRTKYGIDIIYSLKAKVDEYKIVTLKSEYNSILVERCRKLGGRWDADAKCWVFSSVVEDEVEELDFKFNSEIKDVCATVRETMIYDNVLSIMGIVLAETKGRDAEVRLSENVFLKKGYMRSGGSLKNFGIALDKDSKFIFRMSKYLFDEYMKKEERYFDLEII